MEGTGVTDFAEVLPMLLFPRTTSQEAGAGNFQFLFCVKLLENDYKDCNIKRGVVQMAGGLDILNGFAGKYYLVNSMIYLSEKIGL